ncbi:hypothetical protein ABIA33_006536 [Streptacidiphilus sp. MAP12-16]|uniref:hypothetical protein n=1 Tax=Streptacidiphilus sp. MAP12-16 TaxID=3156300 RepID=UPI003516B746
MIRGHLRLHRPGRLRRVPLAAVPVLLVGVLAVSGCGTQRIATTRPSVLPAPVSATPAAIPPDPLCAGEKPSPVASGSRRPDPAAGLDAPPNYADNHGFQVPFPLHGAARCQGRMAASRIDAAVDPLRRQRDFTPAAVMERLVALGYPANKVFVTQNGPTGVAFTLGSPPLCFDGRMDLDRVHTDAFGGYPDSGGCTMPQGGH